MVNFFGFFKFFCGSWETEMLVTNLTVAMRLQPPAPFEIFLLKRVSYLTC